MKKLLVLAFALSLFSGYAADIPLDEAPHATSKFLLTPLWGPVQNDLASRDSRGRPVTLSDEGPMYGLHAVAFGRGWSLTDFLFFADVNNTDVSGNMFFGNWYTHPDSNISPNLGVGQLWHEIETQRQNIKADAPKLHLALNPYTGYAWEGVETAYSKDNSEYVLYGISAKWQWRMFYVSGKYYYQDNMDSDGENFETYRMNATTFLTKSLGLTVRYDHMEHQGSTNDSWLFGPTVMF